MKRVTRYISIFLLCALLISCMPAAQGSEAEKQILCVVEGDVLLDADIPLPGDFNDDGILSDADAIYLLWHTLFADSYPVRLNPDVNWDGVISDQDAIYLLWHTLFTDSYPLYPGQPEETPDYDYTTGQTHTPLPYTQRYIYSTLNEQEKEWYRRIDKAVNDLEDEVFLGSANLMENQNYSIYFKYMMDHPEHFYLTSRIGVYGNGYGYGLILGYSDGKNCSGYGYGGMTQTLRQGILEKKATFQAAVDQILSTIPSNAPDVVKEKLIYDRILLESSYNQFAQWDGLAEDNWTAYGVMVNKTGVCESYSEAFQLLCLEVGINCTGVVGYAGGGHKWNAVELDGEWYACDITFDDPIGGDPNTPYHDFFNVTTEYMLCQWHTTINSDFPGPECTGTKYSYENYFNQE